MTLPTLYKKSSTGSLQQWAISVCPLGIPPLDGAPTIVTEHGRVGGAIQRTEDVITEGKNIGKANETTPLQQAEAEALAKWEKQKKKGYVESIASAEAGKVDGSVIADGTILPMLAPSKIYPIHANHLSWPVYVQPKLDGSRCIAIVRGGKCTLWTRNRKPIRCVPHIVSEIEKMCAGMDDESELILDGELYSHDLRNEFEELMSIIRKDEPSPGHEKIEYHVYDVPSLQENFGARIAILQEAGLKWPLVQVETLMAHHHDEVMELHERNLSAGYEGSMVRNNGPYESGKRSFQLQKLKNFEDAEFQIVRAEEGRGKDAGTVGAFVCVTPQGKEFGCRLKASYARRRELFERPEEWRDKFLTVAYQNLTADGIPRFPIGKSLRAKDET